MRKRIVGLICAVAVLASMLSVGFISTFAVDEPELYIELVDGEGTPVSQLDAGDTFWLAVKLKNYENSVGSTVISKDGDVVNKTASSYDKAIDNANIYIDYNKDAFGFTGKFSNSYKSGLGNVTVTNDTSVSGQMHLTVKADDAAVSKEALDAANGELFRLSLKVKTGAADANESFALNEGTATSPASIGVITKAAGVEYDSVTHMSAMANLKSNASREVVVGEGAASSEPAPSSSEAPSSKAPTRGEVINTAKGYDESEWTASNASFTYNASKGTLTASAVGHPNYDTLTNNETFDFTEGFSAQYKALPRLSFNNYSNGKIYVGMSVGNVKTGIYYKADSADTTREDGIYLAICVDDSVVAFSNLIAGKEGDYPLNQSISRYFYYNASGLSNTTYKFSYDPETKTVTAEYVYDGSVVASVAFTDSADAVDMSEAKVALISNDSFGNYATYANIVVKGADDESSSSEPAPSVPGEKLTSVIDESLVDTNWDGDTACILSDGKFHIKENSAKTIYSKRTFDLTDGFEFKSKLVMKNSYNNFYGEYCAMYVGEAGSGLELRIKHDKEGRGVTAFYNGYLYFEGQQIASVDLVDAPNGVYSIRYSDGKVSVYLNDTAITWTLADSSTSTVVDVDGSSKFANVALGYRIFGNYHPTNRYWQGFYLAPLTESPSSSEPASSEPVSSEPVSSEPASSVPASSVPASSVPASSVPASSVPASSVPASSVPASSVPASSAPASSEPVSSEPASSAEPTAKGVVISEIVNADWTQSDAANGTLESVPEGTIVTATMSNSVNGVLLYKDTFNFSDGFSAEYYAKARNYWNNFADKAMYDAFSVGNVAVGRYAVMTEGTDKLGLYLAITVNGTVVAKEPLFTADSKEWKSDIETKLNFREYEANTEPGLTSNKYTLSYDPETKTITAAKYKGSDLVTTVTYTDSEGLVDLTDSEIKFFSNNSSGKWCKFTKLTLKGANESGEGGGENGESGETVRGDKLTSVIEGALVADDWDGDTNFILSDGQFYFKDNAAKTIYSKKTFDLTGGFEFKSKLVMQNGYNNFYGEYCAMYVGEAGSGLELRIQQDMEGRGKSAFYNGYLYFAGQQIASVDLINAPNGEYSIKYSNGKVSVYLNDTALSWTLADGSTSTAVAVDGSSKFANVALGYRINGNYHPTARYWEGFYLAPLGSSGTGAGGTGDTRNIVVPICVMLVSVCAVAFVLTRKKSRA